MNVQNYSYIKTGRTQGTRSPKTRWKMNLTEDRTAREPNPRNRKPTISVRLFNSEQSMKLCGVQQRENT
jgi:hypothetical protein